MYISEKNLQQFLTKIFHRFHQKCFRKPAERSSYRNSSRASEISLNIPPEIPKRIHEFIKKTSFGFFRNFTKNFTRFFKHLVIPPGITLKNVLKNLKLQIKYLFKTFFFKNFIRNSSGKFFFFSKIHLEILLGFFLIVSASILPGNLICTDSKNQCYSFFFRINLRNSWNWNLKFHWIFIQKFVRSL